ncbi:MAG: molecular chaperone TorD family protein [Rhodobacteraceae bacterium]|nr:molecular chaperone TorD family protein [Paracoccaceae bacterium]
MQSAANLSPMIAEEDRLRADLYGFLSALLAAPADKDLLAQSAALTGDDTPLGRSIATLAKLAAVTGPESVEREFNTLFIGLGRGELLPYASYYMTGFLHEKPLALLRRDMAALGISRAPNVFEPEDNIASLLEVMAGLITGRFGDPATVARQRDFFNRHIAPWAPHFFTDLEGAKGSVFYAPVGAIGRHLMDIEREAFRLGAAST